MIQYQDDVSAPYHGKVNQDNRNMAAANVTPLICIAAVAPNAGMSAFSRNVPLTIARTTSKSQSATAFQSVAAITTLVLTPNV